MQVHSHIIFHTAFSHSMSQLSKSLSSHT